MNPQNHAPGVLKRLATGAIASWFFPLYWAIIYYGWKRPFAVGQARGDLSTQLGSAADYLLRSYRYLYNVRPAGKSRLRHARSTPVESTPYRLLKKPVGTPVDSVLFVTYHPHGLISDHVSSYIRQLKRIGCSVILIKVVDDLQHELSDSLIPEVDAAMVRKNSGFDFGAWAHGLRLFPEVLEGSTLWIVNDSMFGPARPELFDAIGDRIRKSDADLVGLIESYEKTHHYQSFFLVFKNLPKNARQIRQYWQNVRNLDDKYDVICEYELALTRDFLRRGLDCRALFPANSLSLGRNPSIHGWENLLDRGFPFLKVALLRSCEPKADLKIRRERFAEMGYDLRLADQHLQAMNIAG